MQCSSARTDVCGHEDSGAAWFDLWIQRSLRAQYRLAANDIPPDLMELAMTAMAGDAAGPQRWRDATIRAASAP